MPQTPSRLVEDFISEVQSKIDSASLYMIGESTFGDADLAPLNAHLLILTPRILPAFLDSIAKLGADFGPKGFPAPMIMDEETLARARDTFPMELLIYSRFGRPLSGNPVLADLKISGPSLRLQLEREFRNWQQSFIQAYIKSAGNRKWLGNWVSTALLETRLPFRALARLVGCSTDGPTVTLLPGLEKAAHVSAGLLISFLEKSPEMDLSVSEGLSFEKFWEIKGMIDDWAKYVDSLSVSDTLAL